ncbi:acetyl-coenzyme A synthetase [Solenopsis invicta]|uniref:acetyl-coenzyme A synthetase n=1 Tax=Solenopsis invicta TaxID=13686 RepID=UPI00193D1CFE|nr:acetyl-coenzyme A synthetase [Solenopsis invicta]
MENSKIFDKMVENNPKNVTIENGIYKGLVKHNLGNYGSLGELLWININNNGDKIAHLDARTEETVTYTELQNKVVKCALWLQKQGIKSGDVITVCTDNHINSIVPCFSTAYINAIFNPWYENMDSKTTLYYLQMTMPKIIFCSEKSVHAILSAIKEKNYSCKVVVFGKHVGATSFSDILEECNNTEAANFRYVKLDDIKQTACIMHSSGTTGMPKGIELSNCSMIALVQTNNTNSINGPSLWYSSLYWMTGIMMNFCGIAQSFTAIIYPEFDEEMTCRLIEKYKIQDVFLNTSMATRLLKSGCVKKYQLSSLKFMKISGTSVKLIVLEELRRILSHVQILQCYGMTELGDHATMQLPNSKNASCGVPVKNVQIKIVDPENGTILGLSQSGEICIKHQSLMTGYYKNPEATKNVVDEEGWMHSGDIGYMDKNGELFIIGRIKELIKYRGYQVSPGEIENVLHSHPSVLEVAVIGVLHAIDDEHPLAFVSKKPEAKVTEQELIDFVAKNMMDIYKLRAGVIFIDRFPYTATGKMSKKDLKAMAKELLKYSDKMVENNLKNFTIENGIYKGLIKYNLGNYGSLGELMWINISSNGNKIAQIDARTEETVTYTELQNKIVKCALWLQKQGIKSGDVITVCTGNHINSIVPCLSAAYINAIFNPWYENMDSQTTLYYLQMMTPKIIFCSEKSVHAVLSAVKKQNYSCKVVVFGKHAGATSFFDILKNCNDAETANFRYVKLDDIKQTACILHSSGTTGMPKGIELSNYSMIALIQTNNMNVTNMPSLWYSSLYWMTGIIMNFCGIAQSFTAIIYPEFDEEMTCRLIEKYKIQDVFLSTNMANRLLKTGYVKKYQLSSLKFMKCSGTSIKPIVQEELRRILSHVQILQCYGMTELGDIATIQLPNSKNGSCGVVVNNVQMKIVDPESGKILGPKQPGEVCIKHPSLMTGYYKNPEATKNAVDEEGWMHSGDIGYIDENGELFIIDRIKELIKYRGYQVSPGEIENVLHLHPAVLEVAVIGVPHAIDDEHPLAFVSKQLDAKVTEQELIDFVAKNMTDIYKLRAGVIFLDRFPYTATGKMSKKDLKAIAKELLKYND